MSLYLKDPGSRIDYAIDWATAYLGGGTLISSQWAVTPVEPGGVVVAQNGFDPGRAVAVIEGGVAGHVYRVTNRITIADGRVDERALVLRVEDRA